ncbi:MAG TPA: class I adenylate-forming enzyme family protein [Planctomycetota bacterium]|nr:class I adenylate-forming enzyme family protein [Planctomycetota bacterium]
MTVLSRLSLALGRKLTLGNFLDRAERAHGGDGIAHVVDAPLDYRTLAGPEIPRRVARAFVARAGAGLVANGIAPGDHVIVLAPNRIDTLYAILAIARAGAVAVPLHPLAREKDLASVAEKCGARAALVDPALFTELDCKKTAPRIERWILMGSEKTAQGELSLDALAAGASPDAPEVERKPEDVAVLLFTSGTTGQAKGARLSSRSLLAILRPLALAGRFLTRTERILEALPIAHVMGLSVHLAGLASGVPVRHVTRFDAQRMLQLVEETHPSVFVGVPAMYRSLVEAEPEKRDLRSVRAWISGADAMPPELIAKMKSLGSRVGFFIELYGSVELSGPALVRISPPGLDPEGGFLGMPLLSVSTRVAGDDGNEVKAGETGELWIKGPGVMVGNEGEWFKTGDLARRERFGLVRFVGRKKDVFKVSGYTVAPEDVEASLAQHPAVLRAVAFPMQDEKKGEAPALAVVLRPGEKATEEELLAHAAAHSAAYKRPRAVFIVADLPMTSTMKVERKKLAERFKDR